MTLEEITRWFRLFRNSPEYRDENGSHTVPVKCLLDFAGIDRKNFYALLRRDYPLTANYERRLSYAIEQVQKGLRFRRVDRVWEISGDRLFAKLPGRDYPQRL
jgi:hypothetical protein